MAQLARARRRAGTRADEWGATAVTQGGDRGSVRRQVALATLRWGMAAIVVAAVHFTAAWAALNWHEAETTPDAPPPAVMINLAPLAVAPPSPPQEVAPGPQMTEAQPIPTPNTLTPVDETPDLTPPTPVATPDAAQSPIRPSRSKRRKSSSLTSRRPRSRRK